MSDAIRLEYEVPWDDFTRAGEASSDVKRLLKKLGVAPGAVRRVAIALYEGEINLAIHGGGGQIVVEVSPEEVSMVWWCSLTMGPASPILIWRCRRAGPPPRTVCAIWGSGQAWVCRI